MTGLRAPLLGFLCMTALAVSVGPASAAGAPERRSSPAALREMLGNLDPQGITTGILYDLAVPLSRIDAFDGGDSSPSTSVKEWKQIVFELRVASLEKPSWPSLDEIDGLARQLGNGGAIPVAFLDVAYNRIRSDAFESGALAVRGGRVVVTGSNPYPAHRAFTVTALHDYTHRGEEVVFAFDRRLYLSNSAKIPETFEVDFDDGAGFRGVRLGDRCAVRYAKPGRKTVRVRAPANGRLADGGTAAGGPALSGSFYFRVEHLQTPSPDDTLDVTASIAYQGQYGAGEAYVYLAAGHAAIANPVVVVEGFDLDNTMNWDELYQLLNQASLLETLRSRGFDAVVLNFADATDYVQKNSFVVVELLQQIDAMLDPYRDIALIGGSMGGLCARYALAYMEHEGLGHDVRTFISFDGPHGGANIPLGMQYWLDFFSDLSDDAAFLLGRLDTPAARQLLVYHHTTPPGSTGQSDPLRPAMLADFALVGGYPALTRNVAVANGSGSMQGQDFASGDQLIEYEYSGLFISIVGNVWAVPNAASQVIFDGRTWIFFSTNQLSVNVSATRPYDNAPGGRRNSMAQMDSTDVSWGDIVALHTHHCFVPTVSALDLATNDLFYDIAGDPDIHALTPFDAVYCPAGNQDHMTITAETAGWLVGEIETGATAVQSDAPPISALFLSSPRPNPASQSTLIPYSLPRSGEVTITVHDALGRRVATVLDTGDLPAGSGVVRFDTSGLASGVYFIRMNAPGARASRKITIVR